MSGFVTPFFVPSFLFPLVGEVCAHEINLGLLSTAGLPKLTELRPVWEISRTGKVKVKLFLYFFKLSITLWGRIGVWRYSSPHS